MRSLFIVFTCAAVIGLIIVVVINAPAPKQFQKISVNRIEIENKPQTILKSNPAGDHILDYFPELTHPINPTQDIAPSAAGTQPGSTRTTAGVGDQDVDKNRLMAMIDDWVYKNYTQFGSVKRGQINQSREGVTFDITEGETLDNGIIIQQLTPEQCTLRYGDATFHMRLAQEPDFFAEMQERPRTLTPAEQKEAYDYYMKRFGDKFKALSQGYEAMPGVRMPKPVDQNQQQQGLQEYMEKYGQRFVKEGEKYKLDFPMPEEQLENYKEYWQKFHPNKEMPPFSAIQEVQQLGPGNRIPADNNNQ